MPEFRLNPTITQPCPKCGQDLQFIVKLGDQAIQCEGCKSVIRMQLPEGFKSIQKLCSEFESTVNDKIRLID